MLWWRDIAKTLTSWYINRLSLDINKERWISSRSRSSLGLPVHRLSVSSECDFSTLISQNYMLFKGKRGSRVQLSQGGGTHCSKYARHLSISLENELWVWSVWVNQGLQVSIWCLPWGGWSSFRIGDLVWFSGSVVEDFFKSLISGTTWVYDHGFSPPKLHLTGFDCSCLRYKNGTLMPMRNLPTSPNTASRVTDQMQWRPLSSKQLYPFILRGLLASSRCDNWSWCTLFCRQLRDYLVVAGLGMWSFLFEHDLTWISCDHIRLCFDLTIGKIHNLVIKFLAHYGTLFSQSLWVTFISYHICIWWPIVSHKPDCESAVILSSNIILIWLKDVMLLFPQSMLNLH